MSLEDYIYVFGSGVEVHYAVTNERCLGHPEEDHDKSKAKGTSHGVKCHSIVARLDNTTGWTSYQIMLAQILTSGHLLIGAAKLIPPRTPRLKIADRNPRS